jgi:hypothetical protein
MRRLLSRWFLMAAALLLLVYAADRVSLVYRIPPGRQQYGSVEVRTLSAVRLKNNRVQYLTDPPEARQCAHSLLVPGAAQLAKGRLLIPRRSESPAAPP